MFQQTIKKEGGPTSWRGVQGENRGRSCLNADTDWRRFLTSAIATVAPFALLGVSTVVPHGLDCKTGRRYTSYCLAIPNSYSIPECTAIRSQ